MLALGGIPPAAAGEEGQLTLCAEPRTMLQQNTLLPCSLLGIIYKFVEVTNLWKSLLFISQKRVLGELHGWKSVSFLHLSSMSQVWFGNQHHLTILMGKSIGERRWGKILLPCNHELCSWERKTTALRTKYWLTEQWEGDRNWLPLAVSRSCSAGACCTFFSEARGQAMRTAISKYLNVMYMSFSTTEGLFSWVKSLMFAAGWNPSLLDSTDSKGHGRSTALLEQWSAPHQAWTQDHSNSAIIYIN